MAGDLQPLDEKFAIVGPDGRPTLYFIRWAQQRQIDIGAGLTLLQLQEYLDAHALQEGSGIQITPSGSLNESPTIAADVQEILDQISTTRGVVLYRGLLGWAALAPGAAGEFLQTAGAGADPVWAAGGAGGSFRGARVKKAADQGGVNLTGVGAFISFDTEEFDTNDIHSKTSTVTITIASPGVISWTAHGLMVANCPVVFTTTGALPTGLTAGTIYFVRNPTANTFEVSATSGGASINTSGVQSGIHTCTVANYVLVVPPGFEKARVTGQLYITLFTANVFMHLHITKSGSGADVGDFLASVNAATANLQVTGGWKTVVEGDFFALSANVASDSSVTINAIQTWLEIELK